MYRQQSDDLGYLKVDRWGCPSETAEKQFSGTRAGNKD